MELGIAGKTAIIYASSKGLGKACVLAQMGHVTGQNFLMDSGSYPGTL
jgi:hypothetical protein